MALRLTTLEPAANRLDRVAERAGGVPIAEAPLFRFGLRQLLVFVAVLSGLLAAVVSTNGLLALVLIVATSVVAMHVFATTLGTRLQSRTDNEQLRQRANQSPNNESRISAAEQFAKLQAIRAGPRSPWHGRDSTYLPWLPRLVVSAMVIGGVGGAVLLGGTVGHRTSLEGIIVGAASFAVLGGWMSFLCGNFYGVFRHGFRDALAAEQKDHRSRPRVQS